MLGGMDERHTSATSRSTTIFSFQWKAEKENYSNSRRRVSFTLCCVVHLISGSESRSVFRLHHIQLIMKIFAKRTRTVVDAETALRLREEQAAAAERDGEKAVQELLKLDPSTLNSKERRMVKRYKERDESEQSTSLKDTENNEASESETKSTQQANEEIVDDSNDNNVEAFNQNRKEKECDQKKVVENQVIQDKVNQDWNDADAVVESKSVAESDLNDESVKTLLEGLNSKQRRKLVRRLEREGNDALGGVHQEALRLLEENQADQRSAENLDKKGANHQSETLSSSEKKRKRDLSHLTPEERLRREEQRQKQKEAIERRAKGGNSNIMRHPLNSERRRANRRKPKWERKRFIENEHNTSGYHMRTITKA
jgi:hypothetical protein